MTSPSRDFLVRQAVLNTLHEWYPASIAIHGRAVEAWRVFRVVRDQFTEGREFCWRVGVEFNRLAGGYRRAA